MVSCRDPHPILRVLDSKKNVLQGFGASYRLFWSRHHQTTAFFAPKWPKKPFCCPKQCFWGLSGQLQGPPPYFEGAGVTETCFARFWSKLLSVSEPPSPKKTPFFAQKWPKNAIFWLQTVFLGPEWAVVGPPTLLSGCSTQRNVFCKVLEQVIQFFGAAITKKNRFFCPKMAKKRHFLA